MNKKTKKNKKEQKDNYKVICKLIKIDQVFKK